MKTANASKKYFPVFYDHMKKNGNSTSTILSARFTIAAAVCKQHYLR